MNPSYPPQHNLCSNWDPPPGPRQSRRWEWCHGRWTGPTPRTGRSGRGHGSRRPGEHGRRPEVSSNDNHSWQQCEVCCVSRYQTGSRQLLAEDGDPGSGDAVSKGGGEEARVSHHGGAPVRVLEVVAEPLQVPVALGLAPPVAQVGGAVLGDHRLAGVDLIDQILHRSSVQGVGLKYFSIMLW